MKDARFSGGTFRAPSGDRSKWWFGCGNREAGRELGDHEGVAGVLVEVVIDSISSANPDITEGLWIFVGKSIWRDDAQAIWDKGSYTPMRRGMSGYRS